MIIMMQIRTYLLIPLLLIAIMGCEKDADILPSNKEKGIVPAKNTPPSSFVVRVLKESYNYAIIEWEPSSDSDNDSLTYTVYFENAIIANDIKKDTILQINNLKSEKEYSGKVEVTDHKSDPISVPFSIRTQKYLITFDRLYNVDDVDYGGFSVEKTLDGGYIVGSDLDYMGHTASLWVQKFDSLGYEQWHSASFDHMSSNVTIKQTTDNGFILADNAKIIKMDPIGREEWRYPVDGTSFYYCSVIQTKNNFYLAVRTSSSGKACVTKFDANGALIWEKFYGDLTGTSARYIENTADGNYIVVGAEEISDDRQDFLVFKINGDGDILWKKTYTNSGSALVKQIKPTSDNGYIICGNNIGIRNITQPEILKIDSEGNLLWKTTFLWGNYKTYAFSIEQTMDAGYICTVSNGNYSSEADLVKLDAKGVISWKKAYKPDYLDYTWTLFDVKQTSDGGYICVGNKGSVWGNGPKELGMWLLKTDSSGNIY